MHKPIDVSNFNISDASLGYVRPIVIDENTPVHYGLYHFSDAGIAMRASLGYVAIGNTTGKYLTNELSITNKRIEKRISRHARITVLGDFYDLERGFANVDFFVYKDRSGQMNLLYALNGGLYQRKSSNNGNSWYSELQNLFIHKNVQSQEYRSISNLGFGYDIYSDTVYFTYLCDGMLFMRKFEGKTYSIDKNTSGNKKTNLQQALDPDSEETKPVFISGLIPDELIPHMAGKGNHFIFPYYNYDDWGIFADKKIQSLLCLNINV
jgi:hypothetical protein